MIRLKCWNQSAKSKRKSPLLTIIWPTCNFPIILARILSTPLNWLLFTRNCNLILDKTNFKPIMNFLLRLKWNFHGSISMSLQLPFYLRCPLNTIILPFLISNKLLYISIHPTMFSSTGQAWMPCFESLKRKNSKLLFFQLTMFFIIKTKQIMRKLHLIDTLTS